MSVYSKLQASGNYLQINKILIKKIGLEESILLCELADEEDYWLKRDHISEDGFFFSTVENIENVLGFKVDKQRTLLNNLESKKLIQISYRDMPRKRYIKIVDEEIFRLLSSDGI